MKFSMRNILINPENARFIKPQKYFLGGSFTASYF
jgi:hypothetical protein